MPAASTAVACTNTSLPPPSGAMKPKPLEVLKNFTVPMVIYFPSNIVFHPHDMREQGREKRDHQFREVSVGSARNEAVVSTGTLCLTGRKNHHAPRYNVPGPEEQSQADAGGVGGRPAKGASLDFAGNFDRFSSRISRRFAAYPALPERRSARASRGQAPLSPRISSLNVLIAPMPKIPNEMSAAAIARRAKATEAMKSAEAKKADAVAKVAPQPRIAKKR